MKIDNSDYCPLVKGACKQLKCTFFIQMGGVNHAGEKVQEWECAVKWLPQLLVENAGFSRVVAKTIETCRNQELAAQARTQELAAQALTQELAAQARTQEMLATLAGEISKVTQAVQKLHEDVAPTETQPVKLIAVGDK